VNLERALGRLADILPENAIGSLEREGAAAVPRAAPETVAQAAEVLRLAAAERWKVLPLGTGTKLGWACTPQVDLVLASTRLTGIVAYEPADGTLTARAGTPWNELVAAVEEKHHLSPELPRAGAGTFGGVVSAGASGFDRLHFGPLRHQLLGLTALAADASLVKSGGRVVKNVTGYDLHRLWCGAHGTLCFLVEGTLRLYPAPTFTAALRAIFPSRAEGLKHAHALVRARLQPLAAVLRARSDKSHALTLVFAGRGEAVRDQLAAAENLIGAAERLEGPPAEAERRALAELERQETGWVARTLAAPPSRLGTLLDTLESALRALALEAELVVHPLLARVLVRFTTPPAREARLALERALGAHERAWRDLGPGFRPTLAASPAALELMRRLKNSLDPRGVFAAGRLYDDV
jgi:glycolate oxidase FAD binding subunit